MAAMPAAHAITGPVRAKLEELRARCADLTKTLESPEALADHRKAREVSIQRAALTPLVSRYERLLALEREHDELREAAAGNDRELAEMAGAELPGVERETASLAEDILARLVTADDSAIASVIIEVRAGVGGDESALWAGELLEMYQRYAALRGWSFEIDDIAQAEVGGVKHATATVEGEGAWSALAHEAGVHCVKRVPRTEAQGRIHTSTATVAALPVPDEIQLEVDPEDVDEHLTTAQGPGGQNVNKVATAVQLVHRPTGIIVRMQESKSQRQNREKAWRLLRARLYDLELERRRAERAKERSAQIGGGERSERIRTYRFKEGVLGSHEALLRSG